MLIKKAGGAFHEGDPLIGEEGMTLAIVGEDLDILARIHKALIKFLRPFGRSAAIDLPVSGALIDFNGDSYQVQVIER